MKISVFLQGYKLYRLNKILFFISSLENFIKCSFICVFLLLMLCKFTNLYNQYSTLIDEILLAFIITFGIYEFIILPIIYGRLEKKKIVEVYKRKYK